MKYIFSLVVLITWLAFTLTLAISIFGLIVLLDEDIYWWEIPKKSFEVLK